MRDYLIYLVVISRRHCHSLVRPPTPFVTEIWWKNLSGKEATGPCYPCRYDNYRAMWSISNFCLRDMGFITIPLLLYILLTVAPSNNHWEVICIAGAGERPVIAEHAERSPIIIQNGSSIPSSRKNLDLWPYGRPYMVLLLTCVVNCTVGTPTPRLCPGLAKSIYYENDPRRRAKIWNIAKIMNSLVYVARSTLYILT